MPIRAWAVPDSHPGVHVGTATPRPVVGTPTPMLASHALPVAVASVHLVAVVVERHRLPLDLVVVLQYPCPHPPIVNLELAPHLALRGIVEIAGIGGIVPPSPELADPPSLNTKKVVC